MKNQPADVDKQTENEELVDVDPRVENEAKVKRELEIQTERANPKNTRKQSQRDKTIKEVELPSTAKPSQRTLRKEAKLRKQLEQASLLRAAVKGDLETLTALVSDP